MSSKRRPLTAVYAVPQWIRTMGLGLILASGLGSEAYAGPTLTENGMPQAVNFTFPVGTTSFPVLFQSDPAPLIEGAELADILTVTFPGELIRSASGESGRLDQVGFVAGGANPTDSVEVDGQTLETLFSFFSDRVDLFFDAANSKFSVRFVSDAPEPATFLILSTALAVLFGYGWRRQRRTRLEPQFMQ